MKFSKIFTLCIFFTILLFIPSKVFALNKDIKIGIVQQASKSILSTSNNGGIYILDNNKLRKVLTIKPLQACIIENNNGLLEVSVDAKKLVITKEKLYLKNDTSGRYIPLVFVNKSWYRGYTEIFVNVKDSKKITVVNVLPLEEYLYGVVPSEMPAGWPLESLKAQAVAARTYTLSNIGKYESQGYDLTATVESQVYNGLEYETPSTNKAVNETKGKVVTYQKKLISAFYHSCSGGTTENAEDVWGKYLPYSVSVKDFDQDAPKHIWYKSINNQDLQNIVKNEFGEDIGKIIDITILKLTKSNRIKTLTITGTDGAIEVDGKKFRFAAKLNSTFFNVGALDIGVTDDNTAIPNIFQFAGRGWGHGVGMSQWGARFLAKSGKTYEQILTHYYQNTQVSNIDDIYAFLKNNSKNFSKYANRNYLFKK